MAANIIILDKLSKLMGRKLKIIVWYQHIWYTMERKLSLSVDNYLLGQVCKKVKLDKPLVEIYYHEVLHFQEMDQGKEIQH